MDFPGWRGSSILNSHLELDLRTEILCVTLRRLTLFARRVVCKREIDALFETGKEYVYISNFCGGGLH